MTPEREPEKTVAAAEVFPKPTDEREWAKFKQRLSLRIGRRIIPVPKDDAFGRIKQMLEESSREAKAAEIGDPEGGQLGASNSGHISGNSAVDQIGALTSLQTLATNAASQPICRPGISQATLVNAGIQIVDEVMSKKLVGFDAPGLAIPYRDLLGVQVLGKHGAPYYRVRVAEPKGNAKYLSAKDSGCELYVPSGLHNLLTADCTLFIVEGEFKSLAMVEAGFPCVGIGGISSAAPKDESNEPQLLPELSRIVAKARPSRISFVGDSDTALIPAFAIEATKIAKLTSTPVVLPRIPLDAPGKGVDDLKEIWGQEFSARWTEIQELAEIVNVDTKPAQLAVRLLRRESGALSRLKPDAADAARQRIVKLAAAFSYDPLALAEIEKIAADSVDLSKPTLRAAVRMWKTDQASVPAASAVGGNGANVIILPGGEISISDAARDIFSIVAPARRLFYRGGRVHEIAPNADGTCRLSPVSPVQFRSRIEEYGSVVVWRAGADGEPVMKPTNCPEETANALLQTKAAGELLPNIVTLSACPVLTNKGDEIGALGIGWHKLGGGLYVTGGQIPEAVSVASAVQTLSDALADFDFTTPGDRSRAIASLIAPAMLFGRWLNSPLPVDIGEADASQSGKTYRQKVVAAIYREVPNVVVQRSGGVGGLDESISQKLIDGRPFVLLDNLRGKLDSPYLESVLTAPGPMPARVPHRGEIQVDPRSFVFQITSNGTETTRDLANRASIIRIRKRPKDYAYRIFPEGDLYSHVVKNQVLFLGCVFTVIAEWASSGEKRTSETRHDFREWAQVLDWIVQNIFGAAPLLDQHEEAKQRVSDPRQIWLRSLCIALRDAKKTDEYLASQIAEFALENDLVPPNVRPEAEIQSIAQAIGRIMAGTFGDLPEAEIDGFIIYRARKYSQSAEKTVPYYRFVERLPK